YDALVAMADRHRGPRAWAIESTGGYGAGLRRHLETAGEWVIELDRPHRPARRNGAKSDPLDATRAARDALARTHLAQPRRGAERAGLAVLLATRRSAVDAATVAQQQLHALVTAAPEPLRQRFRAQNTQAMIATAARLRPHRSWDPCADPPVVVHLLCESVAPRWGEGGPHSWPSDGGTRPTRSSGSSP